MLVVERRTRVQRTALESLREKPGELDDAFVDPNAITLTEAAAFANVLTSAGSSRTSETSRRWRSTYSCVHGRSGGGKRVAERGRLTFPLPSTLRAEMPELRDRRFRRSRCENSSVRPIRRCSTIRPERPLPLLAGSRLRRGVRLRLRLRSCGEALIQQRPRPARYLGIDVHRGMIEWCRENLTPFAPSFEFMHHDVFSRGLNPGDGKPDERSSPRRTIRSRSFRRSRSSPI